jgi:hypothetical protein
VLQELVLLGDPWIQCGTSVARWNELECYLTSNRVNSGISQDDREVYYGIANLRSEHFKALLMPPKKTHFKQLSTRLFNRLKSRKGLGATDGRDMLFANVHLIFNDHTISLIEKEISLKLISIDYGKTMTQVYCNLAHFFY